MGDFLKNRFLVATPNVQDPLFAKSVSYVVDHSEQGAVGLLLNRPSVYSVADLMEMVNIRCNDDQTNSRRVFVGGPLQHKQGIILYRSEGTWPSLDLTDDVKLSISRQLLEEIGQGNPPEDYLVLLGHAAWAEGQLEHELELNEWLIQSEAADIIFKIPPNRLWNHFMDKFGDNIAAKLSPHIGHA